MRGFKNKMRRRAAEGMELRCTAARTRKKQYKDKLMSTTTWLRQGSKKDGSKTNMKNMGRNKNLKEQNTIDGNILVHKTVFV